MTSNFSINRIFDESLEINFTIDNGIFNTNNQYFIITHSGPIINLKTLTSWNHVVYNEDINNYLQVEYRWSFNETVWSNWIIMPEDFNNYLTASTKEKTYLQIKYTFISDETRTVELKELNIFGVRNIAEIFEPAIIKPGSSVIFTNQDTYKVFSLSDYKLYLASGIETDLKLAFRFTQTQGRIWSPWIPLTAENLQATKIERLKFCNFQFAFENSGTLDIKLYDLELLGEFQNITANYKTIAKLGLKTQCNPLLVDSNTDGCCVDCIPCSDALTPWNDDITNCDTKSNYIQINDKNLWRTQIQLYDELNKFINSTNSWKCTYVLTDADGKGIDHILHEQQIHNMIAIKDINIIIPDNQFPVDNLNFSGFDLDLIQSFEIHIIKDSFKSIFGVEFRPSKRDIVYICDINQLWEVEQMFPKRGFMNAEAYYRVIMKKYNEKSSRQAANTQGGKDSKDFLDNITKHTSLDALFGINETSEIKKSVKDVKAIVDNPAQQYTQKTLLNLVKKMDKAKYINTDILNASLTVAKYAYQIPIKTKGIKCIEYNYTDNIVSKSDNRAITMWFKTEQYDPMWDWTLFSNYDYETNTGYKLNIYQGALSFTFNNSTYSLPIASMSEDKWYSLCINVDQIQKKIELAVYTRQTEDAEMLSNSKLLLFNKIILDIIPDEFTHNESMFIGGCDVFSSVGIRKNWFVTNIRVWNQIITSDVRNIILNENIVNDTQLTILVDNAEEKLVLPNFGNDKVK